MKTDDTKNVNTIEQDFLAPENEYLFAGGGEYNPVTIKADSIEEATKKWEKERVAVGGEELSIDN